MTSKEALTRSPTTQAADVREIGSDFELVEDCYLSSPRMKTLPWEDGSDVTYVESGRQALSIVETELRKNGHMHLYVPSVFCDSMIGPFVDNGWVITVLPTDNNLSVRPGDLIERVEDGALLHAPYFGRQDSPVMLEALDEIRQRGVAVVVDETHRVFSGPSKVADFRVASLRKLLPLHDGGYVAGISCAPDVSSQASSTGVPTLRQAAMRAKSDALASGDASKPHLQLFSRVEHATEIATRPVRMSEESTSLLWRLDTEKISRRRELNATSLTQALGESDQYRVINPPTSDLLPSHLVLETGDVVGLRRALTKERIYCPIHWRISRLLSGPLDWPTRYLSIPIDQRYSEKDMTRISEFIRNYFSTKVSGRTV